jgi:hypothetical protein
LPENDLDLKEIENKHKGSMAFIIGAGPSLHGVDVSPLKDYVTLTVNSGIMKMPDCDYFVSDDTAVREWSYYLQTARQSNCKKLLYGAKLKDAVSHFREEDVAFFTHKTWYQPSTKTKFEGGVTMTPSADDPIVGARTSMGTAIHLAYIMGCDPIVLMGCDCCYVGRNRYFWQFPGETKPIKKGAKVFSTPNKGKIEDKPIDHHCYEFLDYWQDFADANEGKVEIIDTALQGLLKCFPKVAYEDVLKKFADRKK